MTAQPEQLPSGRYHATTYNPHAKRKGPSKTFDTYAEAFAWARRTEADMDRSIREHGIDVVRRGEPPTAGIKGPKQSKSAVHHRVITDDELGKVLAELPK